MISRIAVLLCALLCSLFTVSEVVQATAAEAGKPKIADTRVERAPIGKKGGLMNPVAWCPNYATSPRVRTVVKGLDNSFRRVWKYRGSLPGMYFPRVAVGRYVLSTTAKCGRATARRTETVRVKRKTARTTMSIREFRRIKRGMNTKQVTRIVGSKGHNSRYGNELVRQYDLMQFWQYGSVTFRNGRVVRKSWKFGHD